MTKEELIIKWQKEFDYYQDKLDKDKSTDISQLYMAHFETRQIRAFIEDIKNLTVETVKLREVCPKCKSKLVAYDYDNKWFCYNCINKWTRE